MPSRRGRPRIEEAKVEAFIRDKVSLEWTSAQIDYELHHNPEFTGCTIPKNMRRTVRYSRVAALGEPWSVDKADPLQAALVLPVLGAAMRRSAGRLSGITVEQAQLIATIRAAVPDLDVWRAWQVMAAYQVAEQQGRPEDTASLDAMLAHGPWRSPEEMAQFARSWLFEERVVGEADARQGYPTAKGGFGRKGFKWQRVTKPEAPAPVEPIGVTLKPIRGRARTVGYTLALEMEKEH